jgi:putative ABC transport system permease protein
LDPLNNGMVVYVSFDRLSSLVGHLGYNILLLQVNGSDSLSRSKVLSEIEAAISGTGLTVFDLNIILERQKVFLNNLWSLLLSLSMFCFVNAISCLAGYLMLSISGQQRDLGIMRALGAKPKTVVKLILLETILLILASGLIGLPIGTAIVFWFFIPEAVFSQKAALTIAGLLAVLMGVLCLSSLYPSRKIAKTPMIKAMSQA